MGVGAGIGGGYGQTKSKSKWQQRNVGAEASEELAQDQTRGQLRLQDQTFKNAYNDTRKYNKSPYFQMVKAAEQQALQNQYDRASGKAPLLSPEEQALLDQYYGHLRETGLRDINQFARNSAAARGFSVSDSPIYDEAGRQATDLVSNLAADQAKNTFAVREQNSAFNQALQQFQSGLRQQAWNNRMTLAGGPTAAQQHATGMYGSRVGVMMDGSSSGKNSSWNVSGSVSAGTGMGCWIAAALYGLGTPEFLAARRYIFERWEGRIADLVRKLYVRFGPRVAQAVRRSRVLRALAKPLFDIAVRKGQ